MTKPILVGVDGSAAGNAALAWAAQHALDDHLTVIAVHVLTYSTEFRHDLPPTGLTAWRRTLRHRLDGAWVRPLRDAGVPFRTVLVEDDSVDNGLLRAATEDHVGLIVIGAHGHDNFRDRLLGNATCKVIHHADCPVVVVPHPMGHTRRAPGHHDVVGA